MKKPILLIIGLLLIGAGVYLVVANHLTPNTAAPSANIVSYACDGGKTIAATYASSSVAIALSDGRSLTLPQTVSGSGIRYEQGAGTNQDVVFWSKGDNAFLTENNVTTYDNCVAGTTTTQGGTATFTDQGKTFSFAYPTIFTVSGGGVGYTQSWMQNATTSGLILAQLHIPRSFEPKTNFAEALFTVGTSADPDAVKTCLTAPGGSMVTSSQITINGITYTKITYGDAGAGNFYDTTSYRVVRNNQCYAIEYTIHSTNIGNYSPDQGILPFDKQKVQTILENMVHSFTFLQ